MAWAMPLLGFAGQEDICFGKAKKWALEMICTEVMRNIHAERGVALSVPVLPKVQKSLLIKY